MFWPVLKIFLFLCAVAAAAYGAGLLMEADGGLQISFGGSEFTLTAFETVIVLVVLVAALWVLFKVISLLVAFVRFALGDTTAVTRFFNRRRERKGFDTLAEGMMALASGESRLALSKANKAERLLHRPELTLLLTAQAAEQAGDTVRATEAYKRLVSDEKTRFVGVRGLMKQKLAEDDTETALKLAERAFALKPKHEETQDILLQLQAGANDWSAARQTLSAKLKQGSLPRDVHRRRDAVLALGAARDIEDDDRSIEAQETAIEANRMSPDLVPAAVMAADAYLADGKPKNATRVIKKAWSVAPHPDLAAAFARIVPDETAKDRIHRFVALTGQHKDHPESRMLEAELRISAEDFPGAREALGDLAETQPSARALTIMAAIERGAGADDAVVKGWLARALTAPRGPQWVCDNCSKAHVDWDPICSACDAIDTLTWRVPDEETLTLPTGAEMLPLIVGQIAPPVDEDPEPDPDGESEPEDRSDEPEMDDADATETNEVPAVVEEESRSPSVANADAPPVDYVADPDDEKVAARDAN